MPEVKRDEVDIGARRDGWFRRFLLWRRISWTLAIIIAGGSTFVASSLSEGYVRSIVALMVALASALQLTLRPDRMAYGYREAWIEIDLAIKALAGAPPPLVEALRKGENRISETHVGQAVPRPEN